MDLLLGQRASFSLQGSCWAVIALCTPKHRSLSCLETAVCSRVAAFQAGRLAPTCSQHPPACLFPLLRNGFKLSHLQPGCKGLAGGGQEPGACVSFPVCQGPDPQPSTAVGAPPWVQRPRVLLAVVLPNSTMNQTPKSLTSRYSEYLCFPPTAFAASASIVTCTSSSACSYSK